MLHVKWENAGELDPEQFDCGYCGRHVASNVGYRSLNERGYMAPARIYICPGCRFPSFRLGPGAVMPTPDPGPSIDTIPDKFVMGLYTEIRQCIGRRAYTAAVLVGRKLLMNVACSYGAAEGRPFLEYINYLDEHHYIPPGSAQLLDVIRQTGNDATHKLPAITAQTATAVFALVVFLLRFKYDLPAAMNELRSQDNDPAPADRDIGL